MGSSPVANDPFKTRKRRPQRAPFERRVIRLCMILVAPGVVVSGLLIWFEPWSLQSKLILLSVEALACLLEIGRASCRERV